MGRHRHCTKSSFNGRSTDEAQSDLESKIAQGGVPEHPAWEDLIVAENLADRLEELDAYLDHLRGAEGGRSG